MVGKFLMLFLVFFASFSQAAEWTDRVQVKGDFRYRHDYSKEEFSGKSEEFERNRHRLRMRLSVSGQINETMELMTRLATGGANIGDTTSTNQTLDDYGARKGIYFDQMYFNWKVSKSISVWAGKSANPFYFAGGNDLIFDTDFTPEGGSFKYKDTFGSFEILFNAGAFWLDERYSSTTGDDTDIGLVGAQLAANYKTDDFNVLASYAHYSFPNSRNSTIDSSLSKGNSVTTAASVTKYDLDYRVHAYSLEAGTSISGLPIAVFGEVISNEVGYNYKNGSVAGIKLNKLKDDGSWMLSFDRRELEKDATIALLTDADNGAGGTNYRGWKTSAAYQFAQNANFAVTYFEADKSISDPKTLRFKKALVDLNVSF
ncbi:MAG: putative porin [Pseudobdellovibrionaceae bacterium]